MKTIVVVEDQTVLATAYRNKFRGEGFNVELATDGEVGLELITRIKPDLVLLDLQLPKLSGLEVLKRVRSNPVLHALPIIVLSSLAKPESVEDAWQAGATLVLSKFNTSPKRVLESVRAALAANSTEARDLPVIDAASSSALVVPTTKSEAAKGQVLLVEHNPDLRAMLTLLLRQTGHQVTAVRRNADTLKQTSAQSFDLFLLGGEDADSAASLCREFRRCWPDTPIIIYSTSAKFSEQQEGLGAGASAYLVKPEDLFNVGQIVSDLLSDQPATTYIRAA